jgi:AmmeMemoRadiSam system protein B
MPAMSAPDAPLPPLRRELEIVPYEHEGQPVFLLADSESEGDGALALSPGGMAVASLLDGKRTAAQLAEEFSRQTGSTIGAPEVAAVATQLEEAGLLETPAARQARAARLEAFKKSAARPAQFSGRRGYPSESEALKTYLAGFFRHAKGPGRPLAEAATKGPVAGLFSPHIDLGRGGPAYAWAYGELADSPPPDLVVALGVAHASPPSPWVLTRKEYETPLGAVRCDAGLFDQFKTALWYDPLDDEAVHRREHSLEFQALWLRRVWGAKTPPWLPVLCSSFERWADANSPSSVSTVEGALKELGEGLAERAKKGQRILILAGIDLAHVGPRFGDELKLGPELEARVEKEDRASLEKALALDAEGFYASVVADGHWRKVCGLSAAYTALRLLSAMTGGKAKGSLLTYGQAPDPMGGLVSFAGAAFR